MTAALRVFLHGLIDYAGLFPPANLDISDAAATYARHLESDHAWMVGRFVCPIHRLVALHSEGEEALRGLAPIRVAGLASSMNDISGLLRVAGADAARAQVFEREGWGLVDVLDVRLPDELIDGDPSEIPLHLERYEGALKVGGVRAERIFYEIGRTANWNDRLERIIPACSYEGHRGFKIRCGGVTPDAYPSVKEVSDAIALCAGLGVPFKATAGLHHPVRHEIPESGVTQHGFFNVFIAGLLASKLDAARLKSLVAERDLAAFEFTDEHLAWGGHKMSLDDIAKARTSFAVSYGSCDIDEPLEDLQNAGLLQI